MYLVSFVLYYTLTQHGEERRDSGHAFHIHIHCGLCVYCSYMVYSVVIIEQRVGVKYDPLRTHVVIALSYRLQGSP